MKTKNNRLLIGICLLIFVLNFIPLSYSQNMYQGFFWETTVGYPLSAIRVTGDLNADYIQVSEVVVAGRGAVTLLDGITGRLICHYNISPEFTFNALAVGNLDSDAFNEIGAGSKDGNTLSILKYNPITSNFTLMWEKQYNVTDIAISDITGDALNEVLISDLTSGNLTAFYRNGTLLWSIHFSSTINGFECLAFSQDNVTDGILVFQDSLVTLINTTGLNPPLEEWHIGVPSKPLSGIVGNVVGDQERQLVLKLQNNISCLTLDGTLLWNYISYTSNSSGLLLYNHTGNTYPNVFLTTNNGAHSLYGNNGTIVQQYLTNSSATSLVISNFFGGATDYLLIGDTMQNITYWTLSGQILMIAKLSASIVDLLLLDMNNNNIPDIITASANGTVYVIGLPWFVDFTWIFVGIGIGCGIIIITLYLVMKSKPQPPKLTRQPLNP